ncbi:MAG TPA: glutathione S-transferase family protein [Polyangia bacterium]|jgi:GST-like protein|nr:glutathione S-transferase family protein [Polyangia bacterium]
MKLYGSTNLRSFNTLKLRAALAETGAPHEFIAVDLQKGEHKRPAFVAINPHGKIPVLVDDGFTLPESDAILWYIGEKYPEAKLLPRADGSLAAAQGRAQVLRWCDFASTAVYPAYAEFYTYALGEADKRLPWIAEAALQKIARATAVMETVLTTQQHLAGGFSLADLSNTAILVTLKLRLPSDPLADRPHTAAWFQRVTTRPAWAQVVADIK